MNDCQQYKFYTRKKLSVTIDQDGLTLVWVLAEYTKSNCHARNSHKAKT